ncbi:type VI secretion system tube protein TssD [Spirosoma daeguense]
MPSFSAQFNVGGFSTPVNYVYFDINQAVDSLGRPASLTRGGKITVEFNSTDDNEVAEWMANPDKKLSGEIVFYEMNQKVSLKKLEFSNAYCVDLLERFDGTANSAHMVTIITISPEVIKVGGIKLDNRWPESAS